MLCEVHLVWHDGLWVVCFTQATASVSNYLVLSHDHTNKLACGTLMLGTYLPLCRVANNGNSSATLAMVSMRNMFL